MDPELQSLGLQLADAAVRNTAGTVADRISVAKARKRNEETIAELDDIINGLLADKSELVRIAQAYEEELVAQRIAATDIEFITTTLVPLCKKLIEASAIQQGQDPESMDEILDLVLPLVSTETITVLQLLGFNFRKAIGEPLTNLLAQLISSRAHADSARTMEVQALVVNRDLALVELAKDPDAYERFMALTGQQ